MTQSPSFEKELQLLRERLQEAEEMHRAISQGEVDAFVVGPGANSRVLLLANAYQRYRQLVEKMRQGAVTATPDGQILFANQRFADMLGVPLTQLYAAPLESNVVVGDRARLSHFLMLSVRDSHIDVELSRADGVKMLVQISVASFSDGYSTMLVTDMRPVQWRSLAVDALNSIRTSVEKLNQAVQGNAAARHTLRDISEETKSLARLIDEMLDVQSMGDPRK